MTQVNLKMDLMISNNEVLKKAFKFEMDYSRVLVALESAVNNREVNVDLIKDNMKFIKSNSKMMSPLRSQFNLLMSGLISLEKHDMEQIINQLMDTISMFKSNGFKDHTHLPLASFVALKSNDWQLGTINVDKIKSIYNDIKRNHSLSTNGEDYSMSILIANQNGNSDRVENFYEALRSKGFKKSKSLQLLSEVLALSSGSYDEMSRKCETINQAFKAAKYKISSSGYMNIGLLALVYDYIDVEGIVQTAKKIQKTKGFKLMGKEISLALAVALHFAEIIEDSTEDRSLLDLIKLINLTHIYITIYKQMVTTTVATTI